MAGEANNRCGRITPAQVDWGGASPRSVLFDDIYFSEDGEGETEHVFLAGNHLPERFSKARLFSIGELGFGSGLNFLKAWALWRRSPKPAGAQLRFFSVEGFPLGKEDMARAHAAWPGLADLAALLREALPPPAPGLHRLELDSETTLTLAYGEAGAMLKDCEGGVDAWFFDGFAPAKNPDMWRSEIFEDVARLSNPGASFATFTVAGAVRRALESAGFALEKRPGFAAKREMLSGRLTGPAKSFSRRKPWFHHARPHRLSPGARLGVIGGGVAGASLARAARAAGLRPTIVDPGGLAAMAPGALAGIVMPRLDLGGGPAARFFIAAYLYTIRLLNRLNRDQPAAPPFNACGVLLGATDEAEKMRQRKILGADLLPSGWVEERDRGLFFPQAGVADAPVYAAALAGDAEHIKACAIQIMQDEQQPAIRLDDGTVRAFDAIVIANGVDALSFAEARALPLAAVAGQTDWFPDAPAPAHVLVFGRYAAPAPNGGLVVGATYQKSRPGAAANPDLAATLSNIERVAAFAPDLAAGLEPARARPRAGLRCQTPDRLPVAGPLPDLSFYAGAYDDLRLGVKHSYPPGEPAPDLYILSGLGSRGLVTAPLAAAMIVAEMTGEPAPVDYEIAEALHPARFFIRDLKRARTIRKG